ncbi:MAG: 1-deoxy-D-xylulose-5-phosphate reductoisomerase [Planctomycetes bacterium]|nr:1-deoxy-D-xylulose-5-phosphate reductoisomerase [Planctomycetota bacterium]
MKQIAVFGSTGSIGQSTLNICRDHRQAFQVMVLAAGSSVDELARQALEFRPEVLVVGRSESEAPLREALGGAAQDFEIMAGPQGLREAAGRPGLDVVVSGITGAQGLPVSLGALEAGTRLALANKESMVMAGPLLDAMARRHQTEIIPVDSEHSALFQCLLSGQSQDLGKLILTASGGPFRTKSRAEMERATLAEALAHPTWSMGPKITIDSATMFNKALEIVEARWLFHVPHEQIDVVVHPQSIVHSMVLWRDGSVIAQMGAPDMRVPIQYAMTHPERLDATLETYSPRLFNGLNFEAPDLERFPSLTLGFLAAERGATYGAVLNAANEEAVAAFMAGRIGFTDIFDRVGQVVERHRPHPEPSLEQILEADAWAREEFSRC